jgi:hypothetical protein
MKHTYSFLAGVALISLTVFATNSLPGYMFLLGIIVAGGSIGLLHFKGIIRLVPAWSTDTQEVRYTRNAGWRSTVSRVAHNHENAGSNPAPAKEYQRRTSQSPEVSGGSVVSRIMPDQTKPVPVTLVDESPARRYSSAARNAESSSGKRDKRNLGMLNSVTLATPNLNAKLKELYKQGMNAAEALKAASKAA